MSEPTVVERNDSADADPKAPATFDDLCRAVANVRRTFERVLWPGYTFDPAGRFLDTFEELTDILVLLDEMTE